MSNSKRSTLKIIFGLFLFCFLFLFVDFHEVLNIISGTSLLFFFPAVGFVFLGIFLSVIKWNIFLSEISVKYPLNTLFRYYLIGLFMNNFFPSSVGGDVVRIALFRNSGKMAQVAASVFLERLSGFLMLTIIVSTALLWFPEYFEISGASKIIWLIIAVFVFLFLLFVKKSDLIIGNIVKITESNSNLFSIFLQKILKVLEAILFYKDKKIIFILSLFLSFLFVANNVLVFYLVVKSIGVDVQFFKLFIVGPVVLLISSIPVSFNSLGLAEGAFLILFTQIGLNQGQAMATALLVRAILLLVSSFGGLFWFFDKNIYGFGESGGK